MKKTATPILTVGIFLLVLVSSAVVFASPDTEFTQVINDGVLSTDILDAGGAPVASPTVTMSAVSTSASCQTPGSSGTFGTSSERIYVDNPGGANSGWNLTVAATSGSTAVWDGVSYNMDFNDPTTGGCADGGDVDGNAGQMTINPNAGTVNLDCSGSCTSTGITKGSSDSFEEGVTDAITLIAAAAGSDDIWRGYLTGATVNQTIPANTPSDTYTLDLTVTATAL